MVAAALIGSAVVGGVAANSASKRAASASQGASEAAATSAAISQDQWENYKKTYQPLEEQYVKDAQNYDNPENQAEAAGLASATVASQFGKARGTLSRTPGLDPSSGAYAAGLTGLETQEAAANAVAQNAARQGVQDRAQAMKTDALSLGKGLAATAASGLAQSAGIQAGLATQAGNQASNTASNVGNLAFKAFDAYNKSSSPGLSTFQQDPTVPTDVNGELQFDL